MRNDSAERDALERWIAGQLPACSHDELRVIAVRVERLAKARPQYGGLDLASDPRDFVREMAEENVDREFYRDCLYIKRQDEAREQLRDEAMAELVRAPKLEIDVAAVRRAFTRCQCNARMAGECACGAWDEEI